MKTTSYEIYREIAKTNGINRKTFAARVRKDENLEIAANKPLFKPKDLTGRVFGRLTVLGHGGYDKRHHDKWLCKCICGNERTIHGNSLVKGHTLSCRCLSKEISTKHGLSKTHLHNIWQGIKQRCVDKNSKNFKKYGARGIKICDEWKKDFNNFFADMGEPPSLKHSIERIDNNGHYEPKNCKWATVKEQARNRRSNIKINYEGHTKILIEWCEYLNLSYNTIRSRILCGWTVERAFETPIRKKMI